MSPNGEHAFFICKPKGEPSSVASAVLYWKVQSGQSKLASVKVEVRVRCWVLMHEERQPAAFPRQSGAVTTITWARRPNEAPNQPWSVLFGTNNGLGGGGGGVYEGGVDSKSGFRGYTKRVWCFLLLVFRHTALHNNFYIPFAGILETSVQIGLRSSDCFL